MFFQLLGLVFGVEDGELCEHSHVGPLQPQGGFQQAHELLEVSPILVVVDQILQLVGVHNDVKAAHLGQTELVILNTRETNFLPRPGAGKCVIVGTKLLISHDATQTG